MPADKVLERRLTQLWLLIGDAAGLLSGFLLAYSIRYESIYFRPILDPLIYEGKFIPIFFILAVCNYVFDLYEPRAWRSSLFNPLKIIFASSSAAFFLFAWFYFAAIKSEGITGRGILMGSIFTYTLFSLVFRYIISKDQRHKIQTKQWLLIGSKESHDVLQKDWSRLQIGSPFLWLNRADLTDDHLQIYLKKNWTGVIVDSALNENQTKILMQSRLSGQTIISLQNFYEFYYGKLPLHTLNESWFAFSEGFSILHSRVSNRLKRVTDILASVALLFVFFPLMPVLALLIKIESHGPALYSQVRVGQEGKKFLMWKFRSMRQDAEFSTGPQWASQKDPRVTRIGRIMRKTRLDELPQLWNILKGEMSFIGPRPERPEFTEQLRKKISFYDLRHLVKPGLTGWAQVMYRYGASEEDAYEKLQFDLFYIKNYSFGRDIEIILKTISVVLFGAGR